jgi:pimeloyl-ACP methyl ester carboxylesterase
MSIKMLFDKDSIICTGEPSAQHYAVFVHGWPDDGTMYDDMVQRLRAQFPAELVYTMQFTLPLFRHNDNNFSKHPKKGYSFEYIVEEMHRAIVEQFKKAGRNPEPVMLVVHDWGKFAFFSSSQKF